MWVVDSTPVECGRSRETANARTWPAGPSTATAPRTPGTSGACACTWSAPCTACPIGWALTGAKADEREVLLDILAATPPWRRNRGHRQTMIGDKNYYGHASKPSLAGPASTCCAPPAKASNRTPRRTFFKPLRQIIESVNDTLKGQLDLERHGGRTIAGVCTRIAQRILALTAAIWHNDSLGPTIRRSLTAYDH